MGQKQEKKNGTVNFVTAMLRGAEEINETTAQSRQENVNREELDKFMMNLKKGIVRK